MIQLSPNTYYRARDGQKAFVSGRCPNPDRRLRYPWVGWVNGLIYTWDDHGKADGSLKCPRDLIAVWVDRPADEPGWEIVDDDSEDLRIGWQISENGGGWMPVVRLGFRVTLGEYHRARPGNTYFFRRPVKTKPDPVQVTESECSPVMPPDEPRIGVIRLRRVNNIYYEDGVGMFVKTEEWVKDSPGHCRMVSNKAVLEVYTEAGWLPVPVVNE